jgi:hypothetical protein
MHKIQTSPPWLSSIHTSTRNGSHLYGRKICQALLITLDLSLEMGQGTSINHRNAGPLTTLALPEAGPSPGS